MAVRRGDAAKDLITKTILSTFEGSFVSDKKIYISVNDGSSGEVVQIAVSLTMPKTPIAGGGNSALSTSSSGGVSAPATEFTPTELAPEDKVKIEDLKRKLNII